MRRSTGSSARRVASRLIRCMPLRRACEPCRQQRANQARLVKGCGLLFRMLLIFVPRNGAPVKRFADLTEQEVLALAITNEEEDSRIYRGFAEGLRDAYPASAKLFEEMAEEEVRHRGMRSAVSRQRWAESL